jgi:hypothetical protein
MPTLSLLLKWIKTHQLLVLFVALDLLVVLLHVLFSHSSSFFHLDREYNLPTAYQSLKLLMAGHLALGVIWLKHNFNALKRNDLLFFAPLAAMFIFVGLDELGQLHENVDFFVREVSPQSADAMLGIAESIGYISSTWMLYYLPIFAMSVPYFIFALKHSLQNYGQQSWLFAGIIGSFIGVAILEFLGN